jgi:hypothetical protein
MNLKKNTLLAIAVLLGALIIAVALVYHGQQLSEVSRRLQAMEQRATGLDSRLDQFSRDLPDLVGQAGNRAGRQAVHGMVDEAVQMPLNWLETKVGPGAKNALKQLASPLPSGDATRNPGPAWVQFDIRHPVINVQIFPHLQEVPAVPWLSNLCRNLLSPQTNLATRTVVSSTDAAEAK